MQIYINEKCEEEQKKGSKVSGGKYVTIYIFVLIIISISITLTLSFQAYNLPFLQFSFLF